MVAKRNLALATQPPRRDEKTPPRFQPRLTPLMDMNGQQTIPAGAAFNFTFEGPVDVLSYHIDVPPGCSATLARDGAVIMGSADGQGLTGEAPVGDLAAGIFERVNKLTLAGTNGTGSDLDVRAWIVAVY